MKGDKLLIRKYHKKASERLAKFLVPEILHKSSKYVITIGGESGSGKTEIAQELARALGRHKIKTLILHQDDYFRYPPKTNFERRRKNISHVGTSEIKIKLMKQHVNTFKNLEKKTLIKPLVNFKKNVIEKEKIILSDYKVMIVEGTYTSLLTNVDRKVFLSRTSKETLRQRKSRGRDVIDSFDRKILTIEHKIISCHKKLDDFILKKDYSIDAKHLPKKKINRIAMLSIHGYVDPKPILGKTDTGGQVTYVLELSKALAEEGIKVDIYTRKFQSRKTIEKINKNVRIIRIPCGGKKFIPKELLFPYLDKFVDNMENFIKRECLEYDIFHSHYWGAGYVAMKLSERLGYFFIHTFHSLGAWKKEQMGGDSAKAEKLYKFKRRIRWEKIIYRKARGLVMTSPDMIRRSHRFYNYTGHKHTVIPAGVNTDFFRPLKPGEKERKLNAPQNYAFWVGRFDTNKGLDYLLKSFGKIVSQEKDLFLVIGGGSKNPIEKERILKRRLWEIIESENIENRVFFVRYIKDSHLPSYYRKAKFFVLPSKFEPFGMTAAEAMSCGTALIVSNLAGIEKYLTNKKNCLSVNVKSKVALGWALRVLNRNDSFRKKIAKNGLALARKEFCWLGIADKSISFYYDMLKKQ